MTLVPDWMGFVSAGSTVVLVVVTWWYARITHRMAESSSRAADAARDAALASQRAAEAAEAGVDVGFRLAPYVHSVETQTQAEYSTSPPTLVGVLLRCEGASVFVHSARLDEFSDSPEGVDYVGSAVHANGWPLSPGVLERSNARAPDLPHRMHREEELCFLLGGDPVIVDGLSIDRLTATVHYSLNGLGEGSPRQVTSYIPNPFRKRG